MTGQRIDKTLVERGFVGSRARAQALIAAGLVICDGKPVTKAGQIVAAGAVLQITGLDHPWVSRGGVKLAAALDHFTFDIAGAVALDLGASTGGFTDVLLARGARRVYAVDVGHGQLAPKLRDDPRVILYERTDVRILTSAQIADPVDIIVCDLSFISMTSALSAAFVLAAPSAGLIALIKPQFEVGRAHIGKGGIVRDPAAHQAACTRVQEWVSSQSGWSVLGIIPSPLEGGDGNREFLIAARRTMD